MDKASLQQLITSFSASSPSNFLPVINSNENTDKEFVLGVSPDSPYAGMKFFGDPIFSVCRADDPIFTELRKPEVVGPHHKMPVDWLPGAKSVISVFLPYEHSIVESNSDPIEPSMEWLYTRIDGQAQLLALGAAIIDALRAEGYGAVMPITEKGFKTRVSQMPDPGLEDFPPFSSNWSERHVAYAAGLGTFGLSTCFISKIGSAGRIISIVTDWDAAPDEKDYDDWLGYCNKCGVCIKNCPGDAFYTDKYGKDHGLCGSHIRKTCAKYTPRYGCGKCQSGVPCQYEKKQVRA